MVGGGRGTAQQLEIQRIRGKLRGLALKRDLTYISVLAELLMQQFSQEYITLEDKLGAVEEQEVQVSVHDLPQTDTRQGNFCDHVTTRLALNVIMD